MRRRRHRGVVVVLAASVLAACGADPTPAPTPRVLAVQTVQLPANAACAGVGLSTVIHGNPDDPDVVWLGAFPAGADHEEVVFPSGYRAVFAPDLAIVDGTGRTQMREGDFVDGACGQVAPNRWLLTPPFPGFRLECGPLRVAECTSFREFQAAEKADGAHHPIARLRFTEASGRFEVLYEDGTTMTGFTSSN